MNMLVIPPQTVLAFWEEVRGRCLLLAAVLVCPGHFLLLHYFCWKIVPLYGFGLFFSLVGYTQRRNTRKAGKRKWCSQPFVWHKRHWQRCDKSITACPYFLLTCGRIWTYSLVSSSSCLCVIFLNWTKLNGPNYGTHYLKVTVNTVSLEIFAFFPSVPQAVQGERKRPLRPC